MNGAFQNCNSIQRKDNKYSIQKATMHAIGNEIMNISTLFIERELKYLQIVG